MISGGVGRELGDALEDVLRRVRREVGDQLVVDRQVRRQHEEVVDAVRQMQVADERAHQPRLADAGGEREAQRRELALEVRDRRELAANRLQCGRQCGCVGPFSGGAISVMRSRISSERRCGGRRLRRPAMALTWRFKSESRARNCYNSSVSSKLSSVNPDLRDPAVRERTVFASVSSSSAIEGIRAPFKQMAAATADSGSTLPGASGKKPFIPVKP